MHVSCSWWLKPMYALVDGKDTVCIWWWKIHIPYKMWLSISLTYEDVNHHVHHWTKQTNQRNHAFVFHRACVIAYSWEGMASTSTFHVVGSCVQHILLFQDVYQLLYFSSLFLYGNRAPFMTTGSCVAAARIPIVGSYVTTIRYLFSCLVSWFGEMLV